MLTRSSRPRHISPAACRLVVLLFLLALGALPGPTQPAPAQAAMVAGNAAQSSAVTAIAAGSNHTCALTSGGAVTCWGDNSKGQLGDDTLNAHYTPVDVLGLSTSVTAIAAGSNHTCALTSGGAVKCWGYNSYGQLGDGSTTNHSTPMDVSGLNSDVTSITAGGDDTCVLISGGTMKCWGYNSHGQLGDGTTNDHATPVAVSGLNSGIITIATSGSHTCALTSGGGIKCWGWNYWGQLGDGTKGDYFGGSLIPVDVSGLNNSVIGIALDGWHSCALTNSGGVKCWGSNNFGELGDGTGTDNYKPVDVSGLSSGVVAITANGAHTCALSSSGGAQCWGNNASGDLGDGTTTDRYTPVDVVNLSSSLTTIAAGESHTCTQLSGGGVKCWGNNVAGQLGDGTTTARSTPVDVIWSESGDTVPPAAVTDLEVQPGAESGQISLLWKAPGDDGNTGTAAHYDIRYSNAPIDASNWNSATQIGTTPVPQNPGNFEKLTPAQLFAASTRWYFALRTLDEAGNAADISNEPTIQDNGFRPNHDGYRFNNPKGGDWGAKDLNITTMQAVFGTNAICLNHNSSFCLPNPLADYYMAIWRIGMDRGRCFGMAATSLQFFLHPALISAFSPGATKTHTLQLTDAGLSRYITSVHIRQNADPVASALDQSRSLTPLQIVDTLREQLQKNDPVVLTMYGPQSNHAVTPYAIEDGNAVIRIWLYDNEAHDNDLLFIEIDQTTNVWKYFTSYSGTATSKTLGIVSVSRFNEQAHCPWCITQGNVTQASTPSMGQVWLAGSGHLLVTNAQGQQLGYVGDQIVNDIPGAYESPMFADSDAHLEPTYNIPLNDGYMVNLDGQTSMQSDAAHVASFGPGYAVGVDGINMQSSTHDQFHFAPDGRQIGYRASATQSPSLTIGLEGAEATYQFQIKGADIGAGQIVTTTVNTTQGTLMFDNANTSGGAYDLNIKRVNVAGEQQFTYNNIPVAAGDTHYLDYGAWDGAGKLILRIDHDTDGTIDQLVSLENQGLRVYLPLAIH